jgi:3-oxoacyl-[acyl-carrier-protein] synthase II
MSMITPVGLGLKVSWEAFKAGKSGIARITHFDATGFATQIAGEVKGFDPEQYIPVKEVKKMDRFIHLGVAASRMALEDSGLVIDESNAERTGVIVSAGVGGLPSIEKYANVLKERGPRRITPFFIPMVISNMASGQVSMMTGAKGPNTSVVSACATGSHSIGDSFRLIQRGYADSMIAGGTEACICGLGIGGFNAMKALSTRNDEPERASRPYDIDRDGFVMGEGAGVMILEEMEAARKRGARIYAEVAGYGMTGDAYHMSAPSPEGEGAARCMQAAIDDAGIARESVGYINSHGTSTMADTLESHAIKTVFREHAKDGLAVSSTKSMIGHLLGGAGGVEGVISTMAIHDGVLPPTINLENQDPECDLDYVPNEAREAEVEAALSNSFGFGGTNASLIFKRFKG